MCRLTCFLKDAESRTTYGCVIWFKQIVYIRPYSLNTAMAFYFVTEWPTVFPLSRKKPALSGPFLDASWQKFWKSALAVFGRNFLHWRKFHKTKFKCFFKDVRDIFSRLKPFSGHSIECSDAFWEFSAFKVHKEVLGAFSQFLRLKTKLFAMKFRCIFSVIRLQSLQRCSGCIFTIFACKREVVCCEVQAHFGGFHLAIMKISSGRIFSIFASKNEAVCLEIQMHFGSSLPTSFAEKVMRAIPRFLC